MITPVSLTTLFESIGLVYGLMLPLIVLLIFTLLTLPAVFRPSARAENIAYAAYCYLAQMLGVLLMTAGGLPALFAVFSQQALGEVTYLGLLLVFGIGGLVFLWHDTKLATIDPASKAIPASLFLITWKFIGMLVTVFAGLSFALRLMLATPQPENWWVSHLIMVLYGLVISWFTLHRHGGRSVVATTTITPRRPAVRPKKK